MGLCCDRPRRRIPEDEVRVSKREIFTCEICVELYDFEAKLPMMICPNQHCICKACLEELKDQKCPTCRFEIDF